MNHIITYIEGIQVVYCKLLTLLYAPPYAYSVKTFEYFVVGITANLVFIVYEPAVNVFSVDEFGKRTVFFIEDSLYPVTLTYFFLIYIYLVGVLYL